MPCFTPFPSEQQTRWAVGQAGSPQPPASDLASRIQSSRCWRPAAHAAPCRCPAERQGGQRPLPAQLPAHEGAPRSGQGWSPGCLSAPHSPGARPFRPSEHTVRSVHLGHGREQEVACEGTHEPARPTGPAQPRKSTEPLQRQQEVPARQEVTVQVVLPVCVLHVADLGWLGCPGCPGLRGWGSAPRPWDQRAQQCSPSGDAAVAMALWPPRSEGMRGLACWDQLLACSAPRPAQPGGPVFPPAPACPGLSVCSLAAPRWQSLTGRRCTVPAPALPQPCPELQGAEVWDKEGRPTREARASAQGRPSDPHRAAQLACPRCHHGLPTLRAHRECAGLARLEMTPWPSHPHGRPFLGPDLIVGWPSTLSCHLGIQKNNQPRAWTPVFIFLMKFYNIAALNHSFQILLSQQAVPNTCPRNSLSPWHRGWGGFQRLAPPRTHLPRNSQSLALGVGGRFQRLAAPQDWLT